MNFIMTKKNKHLKYTVVLIAVISMSLLACSSEKENNEENVKNLIIEDDDVEIEDEETKGEDNVKEFASNDEHISVKKHEDKDDGGNKEKLEKNDEIVENELEENDMKFETVNEEVTAKDRTNLRDIPSQGNDSNILLVLENGEVAIRTGKNDKGWSRVEYEGNIYYAVSNYLTTDLAYTAPEPEKDDGLKTKFVSVNEKVTAKDAVNLRTLPSVTREDSKVIVKIANGEVVTRTGINTEVGWSRVEYNGQILYCISSYVKVVE